MLQKIKADLLRSYPKNINDLQSSIIFIEIDKEKMYEEYYDCDIPFKYIQFVNDCMVIATIPEFMEFAKSYHEMYKNDLFSKEAFLYLS